MNLYSGLRNGLGTFWTGEGGTGRNTVWTVGGTHGSKLVRWVGKRWRIGNVYDKGAYACEKGSGNAPTGRGRVDVESRVNGGGVFPERSDFMMRSRVRVRQCRGSHKGKTLTNVGL